MTTATLPISAARPQYAAPQHKGWFQRALDRVIEARTRQAEVEVRRYLSTVAPELLTREEVRETLQAKEKIGSRWILPYVRGA